MCSLWSNWQYGSIGSEDVLALNRQQAIICINVGMFYWYIYASFGLRELRTGLSSEYDGNIFLKYTILIK